MADREDEEGAAPQTGPTTIGLDEVEDLLPEHEEGGTKPKPTAAPSAVDLYNQRLEGENVPESVRGKSIAELIQYGVARDEALRLSEQARQDLLAVSTRPVQINNAPPAAPDVKPLSKDELNELFQNDPIAAMDYMVRLRGGELVNHVERRIGSLADSNRQTAESRARERYKTEFELFGPEITKALSTLHDQSGLASDVGWDNAIAWIRGQSGNFEKLMEHKTKQSANVGREEARSGQRVAAGYTAAAPRREPLPVGQNGRQLDPVTLEIAETLGLSPEEYIKWSKE